MSACGVQIKGSHRPGRDVSFNCNVHVLVSYAELTGLAPIIQPCHPSLCLWPPDDPAYLTCNKCLLKLLLPLCHLEPVELFSSDLGHQQSISGPVSHCSLDVFSTSRQSDHFLTSAVSKMIRAAPAAPVATVHSETLKSSFFSFQPHLNVLSGCHWLDECAIYVQQCWKCSFPFRKIKNRTIRLVRRPRPFPMAILWLLVTKIISEINIFHTQHHANLTV